MADNSKTVNCSCINEKDIVTKGCLSDNGYFYIEIKQGDQVIKLPANQHVGLIVAMINAREDMGLGGESMQVAPI